MATNDRGAAPHGLDGIVLPPALADLARRAAAGSEGMMDDFELACVLKALLLSRPAPGELIVELGTYKGNTASMIADALEVLGWPNRVVCVDAFDMVTPEEGQNPRGSLEAWLAANARHGARTILVRGFTAEVAPLLRRERVALLVVDAFHSYEACRDDLAGWLPTVRAGGIVFVDDYVEAYAGVVRAVDELVAANPAVEPVHLAWFAALRVGDAGPLAAARWRVHEALRKGGRAARSGVSAARGAARGARRLFRGR